MATPAEILWLKCNDNAANTTVLDSSLNPYTCALEGGDTTATKSAAGKVGTALTLNGSDDRINCGDIAEVEFGTNSAFSICAWVKVNGASEGGYILSKYNASTGWGLYWDGATNTLTFYNDAPANVKSSSAAFTDDGVWVHIAAVVSGGAVAFYRNGEAAGTASLVSISTGTAHNVYVGMRHGGSGYLAAGVDDVRVYSAALSTAELAAIYASGDGSDKPLSELMVTFKAAWAGSVNQCIGLGV